MPNTGGWSATADHPPQPIGALVNCMDRDVPSIGDHCSPPTADRATSGVVPATSAAGCERKHYVLHIQTDGRTPAELLSLTMLPVDQFGRPGRSLRWLMRPGRPLLASVVHRMRILPAEQTTARPWSELVEPVATALGNHSVMVYRGWSEFCVLQRHLPGWRPVQVLAVRRLAQRIGRVTELDIRWATSTCLDADRAALLHRLFVGLVTNGSLTWQTAYGAAALPLKRYGHARPESNAASPVGER
jgi:hypothetical protein